MLNSQDLIDYIGACDEATATSALKQAEGFVRSILGDFENKEKTETYNSNGEYNLILKRSPITAIAYLKFNGSTVDTSEYFANNESGIIQMYCPFPKGFNAIEIKYTAGWTKDTIPDNLKYAIFDIARAYVRSGVTTIGSNVKRESIDGASIEWGEADLVNAKQVINSYKKIYV